MVPLKPFLNSSVHLKQLLYCTPYELSLLNYFLYTRTGVMNCNCLFSRHNNLLLDGWKMWKKLTLYVAFPVIILAHFNAFLPAADGHEEKIRPDFVAYDYLRIRTKVKLTWDFVLPNYDRNIHFVKLFNVIFCALKSQVFTFQLQGLLTTISQQKKLMPKWNQFNDWFSFVCLSLQKFPWSDGNHSFIHNPHTNALPDGYETELHHK